MSSGVDKQAVISECGKYRYRLSRVWGTGDALAFVMLNPSTADAENDDPTIRRCIAFGRREGAAGIIVMNLFAFRATSPTVMFAEGDAFGPRNEWHLRALARVGFKMPIVCAWGTKGAATAQAVTRLLRDEGARLACLGTTKDGHPRHPLYVKGDQPLVPFQ